MFSITYEDLPYTYGNMVITSITANVNNVTFNLDF